MTVIDPVMREPHTAAQILDQDLERTPSRLAVKLRDGSDQRTYAELDARTTRLANGLLMIGLKPGDRVATWIEDRIEYIEIYLAAAKAGLVVAPINARFVAPEAEYQLADSGASALIWSPGLDKRVAALNLPREDTLTISVGLVSQHAQYELETLIERGSTTRPDSPDPDDLYILGYTSGTTGRPKGAMLTHRAVVAVGRQNLVSYRLSAHSIVALTGSMSFVSVVPAHVLCTLAAGGTLIMMGSYTVPDLIEVIERERATFTYVASPLLSEFADTVKARPERIRSLHAVLHSASLAKPETLRSVGEAIGDRLVEGWGMTELCGGLATATTPDDFVAADDSVKRDVFATAGRAAAGVAVRVVDANGEPVPHDGKTIGELIISSPALMSGYWNQAEETVRALRNGWFYSGDLGSIDPDGYVAVTVRRTDLIVTGGMNVYPQEVEDCIADLDGIAEVAVIGLSHERWGQAVAAAVVLKPSAQVSEEEIVEWCRARIASFKKPNWIFFLSELPRTTALKVARAQLRDMLAQKLATSGAAKID